MELRPRMASAVLLAAAQVLCSNCMPPVFSAVSIKSHNYRPKTPYMNRGVKNSLMDIAVANVSKVIRFPEVEYPSAGTTGDYCLFQNDFENLLKATVTDELAETSSKVRNLKREAKPNRKYGMITNSRPNLPPSTYNADLEYDATSQPYCFIRSSYFPDVEYPLSARDMWIPNSWNRLLGAETDRPLNMYVQSRNPPIKNKDAYSKYATSPLKRIIENIHANNKMGKETSNINSAVSIYKKGKKLKSSNSVILPSNAPTNATGNLDNGASTRRTANTRSAQRLLETLRSYTGRQDGNLSRPTAEISSESEPTTRAYTNENQTSVSPDPGKTCATTDSLINYFTSFMINHDQLLSCERELSLSANNCLSTTNSPLLSTGTSNESLVVPTTFSKINNLGKFDICENSTSNSNDSIITWQTRPECSDYLIFLDPQTKSLCQGDYCNNNTQSTEHNSISDDSYSSIPNFAPPKPNIIVSVVDLNSKVAVEKAKSKQVSPLTLENNEANDDSIAPLHDANTTFQSKYSDDDDTWASCTEVPYESSDSYTDHVNDIWSAFVNDSCVICQPISDYSDDACLLFLGAKTSTRQHQDTYPDVS